MQDVLKIGTESYTEADILPLLVSYQMLPQLSREIIIDQAIADIELPDEACEAARAQFLEKNKLANESEVQTWLDQNGMTKAQLEALILRPAKLEIFKQETWGKQLGSYFLKQKQHLDQVIYSLIRTRDLAIAQELYFRVQEGESEFTDLAKEYSEGREAQTGGLIGPVELNTPHPKLAQLLRTSQPGQVFPPVQLGEWFIIVRLEKLISAQLDEATEKRLLNDLFGRWLKQQLQQVSVQLPDPHVPAVSP